MKKINPHVAKWSMSLSIVAAMAVVSMVLTQSATPANTATGLPVHVILSTAQPDVVAAITPSHDH